MSQALLNALGVQAPKEPSTMDKIANALQGFGAGVQGRGAEFLENQEGKKERERLRGLERRKAGVQDFRAVRKMLEGGNAEGANKLLERRVKVIAEQGEDPRDTLEFMKLMQDSPEQAMSDLRGIDEQGVARGWLEREEPKRTIDADRGVQITQYPDGRVETSPIEGLGMTDEDKLDMEYKLAQIGSLNSETEAKRREAMQPLAPDVKGESKLREEYTKRTNTFSLVADNYRKVKTHSKDGNGASDMSLVFSFMKMLDPTSVVREGEYATAENTGGVSDKVSNTYNKLIDGSRLTARQRANFVKSAENEYKSNLSTYERTTERYRKLAKQYGYDPDRIISDLTAIDGQRSPPDTEPNTPQITLEQFGGLSVEEMDRRIAEMEAQ